MILHGCHADGGMLGEAGRDLAGRAAEKALHLERDRPALHPPDPERELREPVGPIETKAAACRRDREISVPLRDLHECVTGIGRSAWPLQRRHHLVRPALRRERAEKELVRGNAPFPSTRLQHDGPAAYDESEGYFSTRIRVRDRTAEGSAVARLEMPDPWQRHDKQRHVACDEVRAQRVALYHSGAGHYDVGSR